MHKTALSLLNEYLWAPASNRAHWWFVTAVVANLLVKNDDIDPGRLGFQAARLSPPRLSTCDGFSFSVRSR